MTIFHPLVSAFGETMRVRFLVKSLMALSAVVVSPALFADPP